eukprot:SAG22_NODE_1973_length_3224_cov_1.443840_2_plen_146_part_00
MVLTDSNESQDQDVSYNMCSRRVTAQFTARPDRKSFSMGFDNENVEGDETIDTVSGPCLFLEEGESRDASILKFLTAAGLADAQAERPGADTDDMAPEERRRWVLGGVIYDAVGLVLKKYRHQDSYGVALGMGQECAYGWLGLEY